MREEVVGSIAELPDSGFGPRTTTWWGSLGFMALEGTGFALTVGALLYLYSINETWPVGAVPPNPLAGTIVLLLLVFSLIPNHIVKRWAHDCDLVNVRWGMVAMSVLGLLPLGVRWFEFPALNINWDQNAYGSILWFLLGLHTSHILTDAGETLVLTVLMFTRHGGAPKRFADVSDNAFYWDFVVLTWIPIYLLLYWLPRI